MTHEELDAIEKYWSAPTNSKYPNYAETTVLSLVAALRESERLRVSTPTDEQIEAAAKVMYEDVTGIGGDATSWEKVKATGRPAYETWMRRARAGFVAAGLGRSE